MMDTSDSSQDSRVLLESNKCKLKTHVAFHSNKKQKNNPRKKTRTTKSKVNRMKTKNSSEKSQKQLIPTGLDGTYWNVIQTDRRMKRATYNGTDLDRNDVDDNDSISKTKSLTGRILQQRSVSTSSSSSSTSSTDVRTLLYTKKSFITCRSPTDSFFLCQILQNIYNDTEQIRIRWCSLVDENDDETNINESTHFKLDYKDTLDINTILMEIKHVVHHPDKSISLKKQDIIETNRLLKKSILSNECMDLTTDNSLIIPSSTAKSRKRKINGNAAPVRKRRRTKSIDEIVEGEKPKRTSTKTTKKPGIISKARLFKVQSNRFLKENLTITAYEVDPFFEDNLPVPFISSSVQSKLAIRAVILNDEALLQSLIRDVDRVCSVHIRRDLPNSLSAIHYAIKLNNIGLFRILLKDSRESKNNRCDFPRVTMEKQSTGRASINTLGFRTAEIMGARGAREGNNALIKDTDGRMYWYDSEEILAYAMKNNCSPKIYDLLPEKFTESRDYKNIFECIQAGHRKLAASIIDNMQQNDNSYVFSKLHYEVLAFDGEDLIVESASNVIEKTNEKSKGKSKRKSKENFELTPIHCAAINPNSKYLKQLLSIVPEYKIADKDGRRPIHFAAACEGSEPLEYLLSKNVNFNDTDNDGNSPLHIAVTYGRTENAEILLRTAKEKAESNDVDDQEVHEKFGLASINRMNKSRYYPLHLAVLNNHLDCNKVLLEFDARIDVFTSITTEKLTPLMLACQCGFLNIVRYLIEHGARVEARDRFKRTPLIHACMYGHAHIVSYLLRLGANASVFDSSMNTALHYAIAYGWYFCVRLLFEAGVNPNCANCWQTTCLSVAFSKGHYGICEYLLTEHQVDINFKTDDDVTLVMVTVRLEISSSSLQQLEYVAVKHKADCTCIDIDGRNAFHYLALNQTIQRSSHLNENEQNNLKKYYFQMAQILFDQKCNPRQMDNKAQTPLMNAIQSKNFILIDFFINHIKLELNSDVSHDGKTLLHYFAINCDDDQFTQILFNLPVTDEFKKMGQMFDSEGRTPFHYCIIRYDDFCKRNGNMGQKPYQSVVNMIRYCLETLECNPDLGIKSITSESDNENLQEKNIFYLLRTFSFANQTDEHPLEIFLKKTKHINILHHKTQRTPLLVAIHLKECKTINILLHQSSCDINLATSIIPSEGQQTPLILACKLQLLSLVRDLLSHPKCNLLIYDEQHNQALHYYLATSQRSDEYLEIFHLFIEKLKSIDKNSLNNQGKSNCTPLHIAVYHNLGTVDNTNNVEQTLIGNECNVLIQDDLGNLPLHNVFLTKKIGDDPVELCALLMQSMKYDLLDTKNNEGNTPLYLAVIKASTVCIMLLLKHQANLLIENNLSNSIIAVCIASNHLNLLITFLSQPIDIDLSKLYTESDGKSISQIKQNSSYDSNDSSKIENWLWKYGIKSNIKIVLQYSLIYLIIQRNWQGALSLILDEFDRFHLKYIQVFMAAISNNRLNLVLRLLSTIKNSTILNEKNSDGQNLFHIIANVEPHDQQFLDKFLNCLYDKHVEWNIPDKYGSYPLHYACVIQNKSLINFLQKKYSNELDFNQIDSFNNTAYGLLFWLSARTNSFDKELLRTLIIEGKSIDCLCNYDTKIAINPLSFGCIESLSESTTVYPPVQSTYTSDNVRTSPLINAIVHDNFELAKFLLELDADVNFPDEKQRTPLMHAVLQNNIDMVKLLFDRDYIRAGDNQSSNRIVVSQPRKTRQNRKPRGFFLGVNQPTQPETADDSDDQCDTETEPINNPTTFPTRPSININASDELGRTCIHYLVQPFPDASYTTNIELLKLLHKSGASLTKIDQTGLSPLQYSINNGCQHLYEKLLELIDEEKADSIQSIIKHFHINDPNKHLLGQPDFYYDAQELIDQYISTHSSQIHSSTVQVDPLSNMSQTGEILIDIEKNEPYDVRLTITDVDYGLIGLYNFYRMQIIKHKSKTNLYLLFTRWGRIGNGDGQHQLTPYSSLDECRGEFCKIFREKTGNLWANTDQFEKKSKKYTLIQLNERQFQRYINVPIDFQQLQDDNQHPSSKLQSSVYKNFFKILLNPEAIRANLKKSELDVEWMPISQLKPSILQKARDILVQLKKDIQEKDKLKLTIQQSKCIEQEKKSNDDVQTSQFKFLLDSICQLTNEYYSIIPLQGYGNESLSMIDDEISVKAQEQKLDDILELELSYKILLAAQANLNRMSPLDYLYKSINCQFEAMNRNDMDSEFILRYIWASAPNIKVEQIFKIARPNDDERLFQRNLKNHYLLWHGTNVCNLISILTRGLLVGPLCATTTGASFGKGIYTADVFDKSLGYCTGVRQDDGECCFMFLCQVALGNSQEVDTYHADLSEPLDLKNYQSRKVHGRQIPDPRYTITRNYGVQMPLGQLIDSKDSRYNYYVGTYNEYIVFDESQIALRYLIQFRR